MASQATPARASSDRRTSTMLKRQSTAPPKPSSIVLDPSVLIAQHAQLTGTHPITIGPNTVLHPHSKISSVHAPVVLGEGVVVYERGKVGVGIGDGTEIESRRSSVVPGSVAVMGRIEGRGEGTVLGKNVVVETNAIVEAAEVGEGTVIEVGAVLGKGCVIGKYCTISAASILAPNTQIPDFTVVYSGSEQRVNRTLKEKPALQDAKLLMHARQLDIFKKLLPNNIAKWA